MHNPYTAPSLCVCVLSRLRGHVLSSASFLLLTRPFGHISCMQMLQAEKDQAGRIYFHPNARISIYLDLNISIDIFATH